MSLEIVEGSEDLVIVTADGAATILETNVGGERGEKGDTGNTGTAGKSIRWVGDWDNTTAYEVLDVAHYAVGDGGNGKTYIAIQAGSGNNPVTATSYWQMILDRPHSALSFGPYVQTQTLGFCNSTGSTISIDDEVMSPASSASIDKRYHNGSIITDPTPFPLVLDPGDSFEVKLASVTGRVYMGYRVT